MGPPEINARKTAYLFSSETPGITLTTDELVGEPTTGQIHEGKGLQKRTLVLSTNTVRGFGCRFGERFFLAHGETSCYLNCSDLQSRGFQF